jgi:hypothetical protein
VLELLATLIPLSWKKFPWGDMLLLFYPLKVFMLLAGGGSNQAKGIIMAGLTTFHRFTI